ncbi:unnamed protein product [Rotaria sp. Silwood1]|nr:unnamed protein product [Rotaria sp. Silwood1]
MLVLTIVTIFTLLSIIDATGSKEYSTNLFQQRLINSFLESKQGEALYNKYIKLRKVVQTPKNNVLKQKDNDEDDDARTYIRRKVVGISDNPF